MLNFSREREIALGTGEFAGTLIDEAIASLQKTNLGYLITRIDI